LHDLGHESLWMQNPTGKIEHKIGSRIGQSFTVTGLLGAGGMGNVYRATQDHIGREVAIKFLPVDIASNETAIKRLNLEARALGQLSHPGIVTTFDFGFTEDREPYLVLELVSGESLQQILEREGKMTALRAVPLFVQVAEAMSYAHGAFIVHRDLKPHNIMIGCRDEGEFAKVLDFGIVKLTSESQHLTRAGEIWGSPFYMSPEQCNGAQVDNRSDIYCLGAVMYRTLTGQVPHRGASFAETVARKLNEVPPPFSVVAPDIDALPELEAIVQKCLKRNPDERYKSMLELRSDLLKLFRSKLDREATMTYEKITAVVEQPQYAGKQEAAIDMSSTGMIAPNTTADPRISPVLPVAVPKPDKSLAVEQNKNSSTKSGSSKTSSSNASGNRRDLIIIAVLAFVFCILVGGLGYGAYALYQHTSRPALDAASPVVNPTVTRPAVPAALAPPHVNSIGIDNPGLPAAMPRSQPVAEPAKVPVVETVDIYTSPEHQRRRHAVKQPVKSPVAPVPLPAVETADRPVDSRAALKKRLNAAARQAARQPRKTFKEVKQVFKNVTDTFRSKRSLSNDPNRFYRDFSGH